MRTFLLLSLLIVVFAGVGYGQDSKLFAESLRSSEKIVKGAPFSAEAQSESVQMLADGNRIMRHTTSHMYRDSEGRFRREDMSKQLGVPGAVVEVPQSVLIIDPVTGFRYVLDEKKRTVRQSPLKGLLDLKMKGAMDLKIRKPSEFKSETEARKAEIEAQKAEMKADQATRAAKAGRESQAAARAEEREKRLASRKALLEKRIQEKINLKENKGDFKFIAKPLSPDSTTKTESLGVQNIEGISAEGTRSTTTIPAGSIGNEREINIVYEKWYSKDLQLIVLSKHTDPRFGEQTYRLVNIRRDEPQMSLFSPPADYAVVEEKAPKPFTVVMPKLVPVEPKPPAPKKP